MMFRGLPFAVIAFWFSACSSAPNVDDLPREEHTVVVLGGSAFGVTVASALKAYDEGIDVVLVETDPVFVTEPYLNLYLAGKIDEKLVFKSFDTIAKRRGFSWIDDPVVFVESDAHLVVFKTKAIHYKRLVDARFYYSEDQGEGITLSSDYRVIKGLKERLAGHGDKTVLIDAAALPAEDKIRAEELYNILISREGVSATRHIAIKQEEGQESGRYDLAIRYPRYREGAGLRFSDNFFVQYNEGLEMVAQIVREDYNGSFLPNMVKEERFIYQNAETLQGIDLESNRKREGTDYLSKVIKIQRDIM